MKFRKPGVKECNLKMFLCTMNQKILFMRTNFVRDYFFYIFIPFPLFNGDTY